MTKKIKQPLQSPRGMHDILPQDQPWWQKAVGKLTNLAHEYNFLRIDTPVVEETETFARGIGESTDIVEKEMYSFHTKGGDALTLRPEFTAGVVRAYIQHGLHLLSQPLRLYSVGPIFRHESPQAGRYRQFNQFNIEIFGSYEPVLDASVIQFCWVALEELGLKDLIVMVNSIGCLECRPQYRSQLLNYYRSKTKKLCRNCKERIRKNPLRLLDCKEEKCRELAANAPQSIDYLCPACHSQFKNLLEFLDEVSIPYTLNTRLVRGLDYYSKGVFEIVQRDSESQQATLAAGGRYDKLIEILGGRPDGVTGAAFGLERIISLMKESGMKVPESPKPKLFLAQLGDLGRKKSLKLFEELRRSGLKTIESLGRDSIKSQLKIAEKFEVPLTLILGQKEALDGDIIIRDMSTGIQEVVRMDKVVEEAKKRLKKA